MPLVGRALGMGGLGRDWLRLRITQTQGGNATGLVKCRFWLGASEYPFDVFGAMTANDAPAPLIAAASSEFDASYQAWRALDSGASTGSYWATSNTAPDHWLALFLGLGGGFDAEGLRLQIPNVPSYGPKAFVVERGDGANWDVLHSVSGEADWVGNEERTYSW